MDSIRIYIKLIGISLRSKMIYRADFMIGILSVLVLNAVNLGLIGILIHRFSALHGWTVWEIVFLYSIFILGHSIYSVFFWHFNQMDEYINRGTFDQFLLRPISPFVQLIGREIQYIGFGDVLVGCVAFSLAYKNLGLNWSFLMWLFFLLSILSGSILEMTIRWIIASTAFWTGRSMTPALLLNRFNVLVQQYPLDVFGNWFRIVVTLIPLAFMNYYPSLILLGKTNQSFSWLGILSPCIALVSIFLASLVWRKGLNKYTGSGN